MPQTPTSRSAVAPPAGPAYAWPAAGTGVGAHHGAQRQQRNDGDDLTAQHDAVDVDRRSPDHLAVLDHEDTQATAGRAEATARALVPAALRGGPGTATTAAGHPRDRQQNHAVSDDR